MDFWSVLFTVKSPGHSTFTKLSLCISQGFPEKQNNGLCVCVQVYYKALAHVSMQVKSQYLQSVSSRPRRAHVQFDSESEGLRTGRADVISSAPRASRLDTQEEQMFQSESRGWKRPVLQLKQPGRRSFFFLSLFVLFKSPADWMEPIHIRAGHLLYSVC